MRVNYILMYGTPYLKYRVFETFEDVSKYLVNHWIVNYSIFKKLEDKEEVEMIYRDSDIHYLENIIHKAIKYIKDNPKLVNDKLYQNDKETSFVFINNKIKLDLLDILGGEDND